MVIFINGLKNISTINSKSDPVTGLEHFKSGTVPCPVVLSFTGRVCVYSAVWLHVSIGGWMSDLFDAFVTFRSLL